MLFTWLFVLLAIAMVVGPIMMVRPTPGASKLAKLRTLAGQQGMTVRLVPQDKQKGHYAMYFLPHPQSLRNNQEIKWSLEKLNSAHEIHFHGCWHWEGNGVAPLQSQDKLKNILDEIPEGISQLQGNALGFACLWDEMCRGKTEEQAIKIIHGLLKKVADTNA